MKAALMKKALVPLLAFFFIFTAASASAATLSLSPASGNYGVGDTIDVQVQVDSGGTSINSAGGTIQFDTTMLSVSSVDKNNSIFTLWTSDPTFSNDAGTVQFSGGLPSAYTGSGGTIMNIHFKALAKGTANLSWGTDGAVYSADGLGTDVLSQSAVASYVIGDSGSGAKSPSSSLPLVPAPKKKAAAPAAADQSSYAAPAAPVTIQITSPTHPDPNQWYNNNNPEFDWKNTPDIQGVSVSFNDKTTSDPGKVSDGVLSTKTYTNIDDGTWYFHIRFQDQSGFWTQIANRQVLIDTTPPAPFTITLDPTAPPNTLPHLLFKTTDDGSGLDHYEAVFDDQPMVKIDPSVVQTGGSYAIPPLLPGTHTVVITAKDRAGNGTQASYTFTIEGIPMATITDIPVTVKEGEPITIGGVANPHSIVVVTLTPPKASSTVAAQESAKANDDGKWLVYFKNGIRSGDYNAAAQMTTAEGATAPFSDPILIHVTYPFIENFGWFIIVILMAAIAYLVYLVYREKHQLLKIHIALKNKIKELLNKNKIVFDAYHDEIEEKVSYLDPHIAEKNGIGQFGPVEVSQKLKEAADIAEGELNKDVDSIEEVFKE